ncbi:MAG: type II secretion system protein [Candidatus Methylacidiphilales bacterium]|nr:type II secretion system protein [Candidatus Methylacidiphilales bacterium]
MKPAARRPQSGFTLIELLCLLVILAVLLTLSAPSFQKVLDKADSAACASNLRQIGIAVNLAVADNNGKYPTIETDPTDPVYPAEAGAKSLQEVLAPYGIETRTLQCRADLRFNNRFKEKGSSYEWRPLIDDEPVAAPEVFSPWGTRIVKPSKFRLVIDVDPVHRGKQNRLYADGHVLSY